MAWDDQALARLSTLNPTERASARRVIQHMELRDETRRATLLKHLDPFP